MDSIELEQQQKRNKTELVLSNIYDLPSMPKPLQDALENLNASVVSIPALTSIISKDQGLVTKILTLANSPLYGLQRKVTSIDFAVMVLGINELRNIILVLSLVESFKNKTDRYLDHKEFWLHSYLTGCASKRIAEDLDFPNDGEAFVAGFLHDMGISIIHKYFHSRFIEIFDLAAKNNIGFINAEYEVLGMNHQQIGGNLAERWNFPQILYEAILNHHVPSAASLNKVLPSIIHLADYMTINLQVGNSYWDKDIELNYSDMEILRFRTEEEVNRFIQNYKDLFVHQAKSVRYLS